MQGNRLTSGDHLQNLLTRIGQDKELKELAADSLEATLELRQHKPIHKPSNREKECHGKLLNLAIKMGKMMKLQEEQVRIDTANLEMQRQAHNVTKALDVWENAVSAPDCSRCGPRHLDDQKQSKYNREPDHLIQAYHTTTSSPNTIALVGGEFSQK